MSWLTYLLTYSATSHWTDSVATHVGLDFPVTGFAATSLWIFRPIIYYTIPYLPKFKYNSSLAHLVPKSHENPSVTFWIIVPTSRRTKRRSKRCLPLPVAEVTERAETRHRNTVCAMDLVSAQSKVVLFRHIPTEILIPLSSLHDRHHIYTDVSYGHNIHFTLKFARKQSQPLT